MVLLNSWVLFGLIPLYLIYKRQEKESLSKRIKLLYLSLVFMFFAAMQPAFKNAYENQKFTSNDYIIALDASYSMQAEDLKPSRYIMAKEAIKKLLTLHPKDRFTLFIFTSNTLLISPPTTDTAISITALDAINPEYILTKSTSLLNLFTTISKIKRKDKKLIIFSDGGDEHNIVKLANIAKKNNIIPYFIATATQKGATLKKDNQYLIKTDNTLVISRINPALKDLASISNGKYYALTSVNIMENLSSDLVEKGTKKQNIKVRSYQELFYIPLSIALLLFFLAITKFSELILLLPFLFFIPQKAEANFFDFYHTKEAKHLYNTKNYIASAKEYKKVSPSVESYYNIATAYYKAKMYKSALLYYSQIQSTNPEIKQKILYNMGNTAVKLKYYDKAKELFLKALAFGEDKDALYNLRLIQKLHLKSAVNVAKMLPKKESKKVNKKKEKNLTEKKKSKETASNSNSNSNQSSNKSTNGGGGKKKKKTTVSIKKKTLPNKYKMSYKAYEKINKGYSDEKEPW